MKRCSKCLIDFDELDFNVKRKKKDGSIQRQPFCRSCQKAYWNSYYKNPIKREKHLKRKYASDKIKYEDLRRKINELKDRPCSDCSQKFAPWIMDFDHLDSSLKLETISSMVWSKRRLEQILKEVSKCEIVCSNCHRDRTYKRLHTQE